MHPLLLVGQLLKVLGHVDGRKKLQKIVHILQELGVPFTEPFEYSLHGMYSQQLRNEVENLMTEGLVQEQSDSAGTVVSYTYTGTMDLAALLGEFNLGAEPTWAGLARHLNALTPRQVEGVSTALFLHRRGLQGPALAKRLLELKPHLSNEAKFSVREAERLVANPITAP